MYRILLLLVLCCYSTLVLTLANSSQAVLSLSSPSNFEEEKKFSSSEQEKINTILRSLKKLHDSELQSLGTHSDQLIPENFPVGSIHAEELKSLWDERQKELKKIMADMVKPAEHMAEIAKRLESEKLTFESTLFLLTELESLLEDIDNAKDFHTIGGWSILLSYLLPEQPTEFQTKAAWAIGTSVKDNYDYQMWMLESYRFPSFSNNSSPSFPSPSHPPTPILTTVNALTLLISHLASPSSNESLVKMCLYAISAASRGNIDIQESLLSSSTNPLHHPMPPIDVNQRKGFIVEKDREQPTDLAPDLHFPSTLMRLLLSNSTSYPVKRKIWAYLSDMLEERVYVRSELLTNLQQLSSSSAPSLSLEDASNQIESLVLMGDQFVQPTWGMVALRSLQYLKEEIANTNSTTSSSQDQDQDGHAFISQIDLRATSENVVQCLYHMVSAGAVDALQLHLASSSTNDGNSTNGKVSFISLLDSELRFLRNILQTKSPSNVSAIEGEEKRDEVFELDLEPTENVEFEDLLVKQGSYTELFTRIDLTLRLIEKNRNRI